MIKHFLKSGTQVESVSGVVLKQEEFKRFYDLIGQIEKRMRVENESGSDNA